MHVFAMHIRNRVHAHVCFRTIVRVLGPRVVDRLTGCRPVNSDQTTRPVVDDQHQNYLAIPRTALLSLEDA